MCLSWNPVAVQFVFALFVSFHPMVLALEEVHPTYRKNSTFRRISWHPDSIPTSYGEADSPIANKAERNYLESNRIKLDLRKQKHAAVEDMRNRNQQRLLCNSLEFFFAGFQMFPTCLIMCLQSCHYQHGDECFSEYLRTKLFWTGKTVRQHVVCPEWESSLKLGFSMWGQTYRREHL